MSDHNITCANESQMIIRNALLFRSNVYFNNVIVILTVMLSVKVFSQMNSKKIFAEPMQQLLYFNLLFSNAHQFIYAFIQNWSLWRSFKYSDDPCRIMFNEQECYPFHASNVFVRLLMLFINCALTIERLISLHLQNSKKPCTVPILVSLTIGLAAYFTYELLKDGPQPYLQGNCFQRLNRDSYDLMITILVYFFISLICLILNGIVLYFNKQDLNRKKFILESEYNKQECMYSTTAVSIISIFQMITMGLYCAAILLMLQFGELLDPIILSNLVLWVYTIPFAALSLPAGIILYFSWISWKRRLQIDSLTQRDKSMDQKVYFKQLENFWNSSA